MLHRRCLNGLRKAGFFSIPSALALIRGYGVLAVVDQTGTSSQWSKAYSAWPFSGEVRMARIFWVGAML